MNNTNDSKPTKDLADKSNLKTTNTDKDFKENGKMENRKPENGANASKKGRKTSGSFSGVLKKVSSKILNINGSKGSSEEMDQKSSDDNFDDAGPPLHALDANAINILEIKEIEIGVNEKLSVMMDHYRGKNARRKARNKRYPKYTYTEIMRMLTKQGIPVPSDDDFARLETSHGARWDPDGTVVEYYSPVLRSFIPINMRGRYRGCWAEDNCIKGLDVSKLTPKPEALEGYIDRGRQYRIQTKYDEMSRVALSEDHLDFLVELIKLQSDILPLPIYYDVLNFGTEVLNENMKILQTKEGLPPNHRIYLTTEDKCVNAQKKLQVYAALGLEPLHSSRQGMGRMQSQWGKTRDELIYSLLAQQQEMEHERIKLMEEGLKVNNVKEDVPELLENTSIYAEIPKRDFYENKHEGINFSILGEKQKTSGDTGSSKPLGNAVTQNRKSGDAENPVENENDNAEINQTKKSEEAGNSQPKTNNENSGDRPQRTSEDSGNQKSQARTSKHPETSILRTSKDSEKHNPKAKSDVDELE